MAGQLAGTEAYAACVHAPANGQKLPFTLVPRNAPSQVESALSAGSAEPSFEVLDLCIEGRT